VTEDDGVDPDLMFHLGLEPFDEHVTREGYPTAEQGLSLTPNVARARSEGWVRIVSGDPEDRPRIDFRYFTDPDGYDERVMVEGVRLARRIASRSPLARWLEGEVAPGPDVRTDEELSSYVRSTANTVYHPAGTCRMGDAGDDTTVVDPELRVVGVDGLRVADASVFPSMTSVNPAITVMAIGERCADLLSA
jgi:choline oxidase